jgi:hypothetical protein
MKNYNLTEKLKDKSDNPIVLSELTRIHFDKDDIDSGDLKWDKYRINASIHDNPIGYINIGIVTEKSFDDHYNLDFKLKTNTDFSKKLNILKYLEIHHGWKLFLKKESRIEAALNMGFDSSDESMFIPTLKGLLTNINKESPLYSDNDIRTADQDGLENMLSEYLYFIGQEHSKEFKLCKKETVGKAIVHDIEVSQEHRRKGIASILYKSAGTSCAFNNLPLYMSHQQEEEASKAWKKMIHSDDFPTKFDENSNFYYLDYKDEIQLRLHSKLVLFNKNLEKFSDDKELNKAITCLWAKENVNFNNMFRETMTSNKNETLSIMLDGNPLTKSKDLHTIKINKNDADKILNIVDNLKKEDKDCFQFLKNEFGIKNKNKNGINLH